MRRLILIISLVFFTVLTLGCNGITLDQSLSISLNPGVDTIEVYDNFTDAGAVAFYNNEDVAVTVVENTLNTLVPGAYYIKYQAEFNEKVVQIYRVVIVVDSTKPVLTLKEGVDTIKLGEEWIDGGIDSVDNYSEELLIEIDGEVDTNTVGTYTITYIVTDEAGNEARIIRIVDVVE